MPRPGARRPDRPVHLARELPAVGDLLGELVAPGDLVITLGAGSITKVSFELARRLADMSAAE